MHKANQPLEVTPATAEISQPSSRDQAIEQLADDTKVIAYKPVGTGTLGKALEVLDIIALSDVPLRFTDILNAVDQPRGTLHRQLSNLIEEGLVLANPDGTYDPGLRLLKLAARAWSKNTFRAIAEPHVRKLHEATGETVHLGVLNGLEVIYVDKIESNQTVRMHSQLGNASPLYCTGIGKAMLALLPEEDVVQRARQFAYTKYTETTLHTPELLLADIVKIREAGVAHDREEHEVGIRCVSAGIGGDEKSAVAGVSITAPAYRISEDTILKWESLVFETARAIERDMAVAMGPRSQQ